MKIYNSLSRTVEEFVPVSKDEVKIYTCGPTVYNFAHIGNLRSYLMEDLLVKTLEYSGYKVKRVMNITDVGHLSDDGDYGEDKMVKSAKSQNMTVLDIAKFYTKAFFEDFEKLNIKMPDVVAPATQCIDDFIKVIQQLMDNGFAYKSGGNIYFDTSKLKNYHVFFNFKQDDLAVGVRDDVDRDDNKRNVNDFVLWFTQSKFENQALKWDSPWGVGYPGWHIECSCIAMKHLGEYVDIHCGGIDNAFPHHTNEIAQSEACLGHKWCNYWMHVLHLQIDGGKMSKSKGEFLTVDLLKQKGYNPIEYRFFCLQSHYRKQLMFSYANLDNAANAYKKLIAKISKLNNAGDVDNAKFEEYKTKFTNYISNDLNSADAISVVYEVLKDKEINDATKLFILEDFDKVLSLNLTTNNEFSQNISTVSKEISEAEILEQIELRKQAKQNKDYSKADEIRQSLLKKGVKLIDTKDGTTYEFV